MRILIVEDEFKIVDVIASRLRNEQYIVDVQGDGEEGIDNALTNIYDLIILDVMLPGIEGFKILQEIRKQKIESKANGLVFFILETFVNTTLFMNMQLKIH